MFEGLALLRSQEFVEGKRDSGEEAARQKPPRHSSGAASLNLEGAYSRMNNEPYCKIKTL